MGDLLHHLLLPGCGGVCGSLGSLVRQTATACGEVLGEDYIRTARAKGLPEWAVVWKLYGFRTALLPVVTTILNHIPHIIGGSLVVERIFGWPGMGSLLFNSVSSRDYTVVMGVTVLIALAVLATGILMDIVYRLVDPGVGWGRWQAMKKDTPPSSGPFGPTAGRPPPLCSWGWKFWWCSSSPCFWGRTPTSPTGKRVSGPPSSQHLLGTDDVGRDIFARLLYGGRTSLLVGFASAALGAVLGSPWAFWRGIRGESGNTGSCGPATPSSPSPASSWCWPS